MNYPLIIRYLGILLYGILRIKIFFVIMELMCSWCNDNSPSAIVECPEINFVTCFREYLAFTKKEFTQFSKGQREWRVGQIYLISLQLCSFPFNKSLWGWKDYTMHLKTLNNLLLVTYLSTK